MNLIKFVLVIAAAASMQTHIAQAQAEQSESRARVINLRQCPLNTTTFVDPWSKDEFRVTRVGTNYLYLCTGGLTPNQSVGQACTARYGDLILKGTLRRSEGETHEVFAVWSEMQATPCCGWSAFEGDEAKIISKYEHFRWLDEHQIPRLAQLPFASIEKDDMISNTGFSDVFTNEMIAMKCELPSN